MLRIFRQTAMNTSLPPFSILTYGTRAHRRTQAVLLVDGNEAKSVLGVAEALLEKVRELCIGSHPNMCTVRTGASNDFVDGSTEGDFCTRWNRLGKFDPQRLPKSLLDTM